MRRIGIETGTVEPSDPCGRRAPSASRHTLRPGLSRRFRTGRPHRHRDTPTTAKGRYSEIMLQICVCGNRQVSADLRNFLATEGAGFDAFGGVAIRARGAPATTCIVASVHQLLAGSGQECNLFSNVKPP
jgi:hypothetical protein